MRSAFRYTMFVVVGLIVCGITAVTFAADDDFDGTGHVNLDDYYFFEICFSISGPDVGPAFEECLTVFDADTDGDIDLVDYAAFERTMGHLPMPLLDGLGNRLTIDSTIPYSPRRTCGACHDDHDANTVANGEWFQQGRADVAGNVDMRDDYWGDGRYWTKSAGRYGEWGQTFKYMLAAKDNTNPSDMDQTSFAWVAECAGCHAGGGPGEFDRNGELYYNEATGQFGYEVLGLTAGDVALDGDYSVIDRSTGTASLGAWDVTGVSGPDCLLCHRDNRPSDGGADMVRILRSGVLAAGASLVDDLGNPVPAYAAAATAGQGWFSEPVVASAPSEPAFEGPLSPDERELLDNWTSTSDLRSSRSTLQIDYSVGVANGSLMTDQNDELYLTPESLSVPPRDKACDSCHVLAVVTGTSWFNSQDVHYKKFTNLNDDDPRNDIPAEKARVCVQCHTNNVTHNSSKGNSFQLEYRDELDHVDFRTCQNCHLTYLPNGEPNLNRHPDAPDVPGDDLVHTINDTMLNVLSCQACHIPYGLVGGVLFRDITMPGSVGLTSQYLSADPLNPADPDKTKWYPALRWKEDSDGVMRVFPASVWVNIYFGDWDQKGTPEDLSDDIIAPIPTWRVASAVGSGPLTGTTDDDGDGRLEINRPEEILAYFAVLKGNDYNGVQVAANPVLVRGPRVWYEDGESPTGVSNFEHEGTGIPITAYPYIWGMDHNVLAKEESWGARPEGQAGDGCNDCHRADTQDSPVFDRLILIDPNDPVEGAIYETVRERVGLNPP